ncbi:MAG: ATP-binding protein [Vicinamibacterales bacterium]
MPLRPPDPGVSGEGSAFTGDPDHRLERSAILSLAAAAVAVLLPAALRPDAAAYYLAQSVVLGLGALTLAAVRRRVAPRRVAQGALAVAVVVVIATALVSGGVTSAVYHVYSVALAAAVWLVFSPRGAAIATGAIVALGALLAAATARGWTPTPWLVHTPATAWMTTSTATALVALVQWLEVHRLRASREALQDELHRSEAAQRQASDSERRYADVVSTVPGVVYEFEERADGARAFTFVSEGVRQLFGCTPESLLADWRVLPGLIDPSEVAAWEAALAASRDSLSPWTFRNAIRTAAGDARWVQGHGVPAREPDGTVRWHGVLTDATEPVAAARALSESQAALKQSISLLQSAFDSTADGLLAVDLEGRVTGCNQKFLALWRVPGVIAATRDDDQLLAHVLEQLTDPDRFLTDVKAIYASPDSVTFDTLEFRDGRRYERYSQPQVVDGAVVGRVWSFRDITARVEEERRLAALEQQLQQAHTLEALGALAGGIARDFNNLLTIIIGNAEQAALDEDAAERGESLAAVTRAAHRAATLVREIGEFSQPRPAERTVLRVAQAIGSALDLFPSTLPKQVAIDTTLDPDVTMFANATQVQQVVTNLVLNAVEAIGEGGGTVSVVLDEVAPDDVPADAPRPLAARYARLTVRDTGRGIGEDDLARIFDTFYTTRLDTPGSGLGLVVVQGIVRRHHGTVVVESTVGAGTTVRVYWPSFPPVDPHAGGPSAAAHGSAVDGRGRRLLVVDDEPDVARVVGEGLRRLGYDVVVATDPHEALAAFHASTAAFDAVLSDLSMPGLTGVELGRRLLDCRPDLPIVLFTGYAGELSPDEARALGFRAVLHKPMSLPVLAGAVHRALGAGPGR